MSNSKLFLFFKYSLLISLLISHVPAYAVTKTALVIGNSDYEIAPLNNPVNDAKDMAESLRGLGFKVYEHTNLDKKGMRKAIRKFGETLNKGGVGLFFFAGHGIQIKGRNYLIPVGSDITAADEVEDDSIDANLVLRKMDTARNGFNIVIMDACRNNPFARSFRSAEQGLARMEGPVGSIIAYATAPGSTASDGTGKNGLYTSHLLKAMKEPGLSIEEVFKKVRIGVREATQGKQIPWESSSLTGHFEFIPSKKNQSLAKAIIPEVVVAPPPAPRQLAKFAHLQVSANIADADVFVDGANKGKIGKNLVLNLQKLKIKNVEIKVSKKGFKPVSQTVALAGSEWTSVYFELIPEPDKLATVPDKKFKIVQPVKASTKTSQKQQNDKLAKNQLQKQDSKTKSMNFNFAPSMKQKSFAPPVNVDRSGVQSNEEPADLPVFTNFSN